MQQIPLPYGANVHKLSRFQYTYHQGAGTSMAEETPGVRFSQGNLASDPSFHEKDAATTTIKDAFEAVKDEARAPLVYPDTYHSQATVGVLDIYQSKPDGPALHGDKVASILTGAGLAQDDIQKIEHSTASRSNRALSSLIFQNGPEPMTDRLDAYIELSAGHMLAKTNGTLGQLLSADSALRTINQSQGSSRVDVFQLLESASFCFENGQEVASKVGQQLAQACGLDPQAADFTPAKLRQAFVDRTNAVIDSSTFIAEQQQTHVELLERLRSKGTMVVTSAGNSADELWDLRARGLRVPDCFDDDLSKVGPKLIVGALDDHGTPDRSDDEIAFFTSLYSNVNVMANGVKVDTVGGPATGTSYATPVVAGTAEKIRRENPDWTVDQIEAETKGRFTATDGFNLLR